MHVDRSTMAPVSESISQRIKTAMARADMKQKDLVAASGLAQNYVTNALKRDQRRMDADIAARFAAALGVSVAWLLTGREDGYEVPELKPLAVREPTPTPPPAKSDTRRIASHYEDPEMEGVFASAIRHAPEAPTGKQVVTSKVFVREKMTKMVDGIDMVDFVLSVFEAVRELDEQGHLGDPEDPATHTRIMAWLAAQSRARRTPREVEVADARKRRLLEEAAANPEEEPPSAEPVKAAPRRKGGR